jgi:hypothetical protein
MSTSSPGYYTPIAGKTPQKIHEALASINGGRGATIEEIVRKFGVSSSKVKREMQWGMRADYAGFPLIIEFVSDGQRLYRHTDRYEPIAAPIPGGGGQAHDAQGQTRKVGSHRDNAGHN